MLEALESRVLLSAGALGSESVIIDNGEAGFGTAGPWTVVNANGFDGDHLVSDSGGAGSATWTFDDLDPGYKYRISSTFGGGGQARYTIIDHEADGHTETLGSVTLNQSVAPNDLSDSGAMWEDLGGPYLIRGTSLSVQLNSAGGAVKADAMRLERVGKWVPPVGVKTPEFGIDESHWMYAEPGQTYNYGNGSEAYRMGADGPYTHFVDNTHSNATDSGNPFGTPDRPRRSIPTSVAAGSVVEIHGGSYNTATAFGKIMLGGVGSASKPIFYRGAETDAMPRLNVLTTLGHYSEGRWIIVENLDMSSAEIRGLNDHVAFRGNVLRNGGGLRISGDTSSEWIYDVVVYNNTIRDNGDWQSSSENDVHGITVNMYNRDVWIVDNHAYHNGGDSVQVNSRGSWTTSYTYIGRNIFHHDRENAVDLKTLKNVIVSENRMYGYRRTSTSEGAAFVVHYNPEWVWAINNEIYDSEYGMVNTGASDAYFIGNLIYDIHSDGWGNPSSAYDPGIAIHSRNSAPLHIVNNTIYDVGTGIAAPNAVVNIVNNIIANRSESSGYEIHVPNTGVSAASTMHDNLIYNANGSLRLRWGATYSSLDAFKSGSGKGSGSIEADPQFIAAGSDDFRLAGSSPAIDQGSSFAGYANLFQSRYGLSIASDLDNAPRVYGSTVDFGAYEVGAGGGTTDPNEAPTADDFAITIDEDGTAAATLTGDDPDGDAVTFGVADQPAHGTVVVNPDGSFTYVPAANWNGTDTFTFSTHDGWYDSAPATVTVTVRSVNDAPVVDDQQLSTLRDTVLAGSLDADDADGDGLTSSLKTGAAHGSVNVEADGSFTYTPNAAWGGTDSFTVNVSDGTVTSTATVTVMVGSPVLSVDTSALAFGLDIDTLTFAVQNAGEAQLDYSISTSAQWLTVTPVAGASTGEVDSIAVTVDRSEMVAGEHAATITVDGGVGGSYQIQVTIAVPVVVEQTVINPGDTWAYRKGTSAPPSDWTTHEFDDSTWATGASGIGYSSDLTYPTELNDMEDNYMAFFARSSFHVSDAQSVVSLKLGMVYDDGFVAYINGVEVARSESMGGTPGTPVAFDEATVTMHDELDGEEMFVLNIPADLLHDGANTLAIEVHNVVDSSSDAVMIPRLVITMADTAPPAVTGDINLDGIVDVTDIDLLQAARRGEYSADLCDLTGDGQVGIDDLDVLVSDIMGTEFGDADLDGDVDLVDFVTLKQNMHMTDASWADGDFDGDGTVSLDDFTVMKLTFGFSGRRAAATHVDQLGADQPDVLDALAMVAVPRSIL